MRHRLFAHLVWTTRMRERSITAPAARFLGRYLRAVARQERSEMLACGLVADHVHVLLAMHPTTSIPRLVQRLKGGSAVVAAREGAVPRLLRWAKGYSIESVSPSQVRRAIRYVETQAEHHPDRAIRDDPVVGPPGTPAGGAGSAAEAAARHKTAAEAGEHRAASAAVVCRAAASAADP